MNTSSFSRFSLNPAILASLEEKGYTTPTPVQEAAIPLLLDGRDIRATAQTGTGKTAAFALPMLHILNERQSNRGRVIRGLILTPTRELALQIHENIRVYGKKLSTRSAVILGGVSASSQIDALRKKPAILVATPGRLLDLHGQGLIDLGSVEFFVLDEADRMLDMGFIGDVRKIASFLPKKRQTMLFSATLSPEITELAYDLLNNPAVVEVSPPASVSCDIDQRVFFVERSDKRDLLANLLQKESLQRALVFVRTKHHADRVSRHLSEQGIKAESIHSNKSQNARQRALSGFDRGHIQVLVGTDIVSRGIDVEGITHVINYELPNDPASYVHRIGRTARAGAKGSAFSFCEMDELSLLRGIELLTHSPLTVEADHPYHSKAIASLREKRIARDNPAPKPPFLRHSKPTNRFGSRAGRAR